MVAPDRGSRSMPSRSQRALGPCSILTVGEAVAELGMRDADAIAWLREHDLICMVAGRRRVVAGDLADAVRGAPSPSSKPAKPRKRKRSLKDMPQAIL